MQVMEGQVERTVESYEASDELRKTVTRLESQIDDLRDSNLALEKMLDLQRAWNEKYKRELEGVKRERDEARAEAAELHEEATTAKEEAATNRNVWHDWEYRAYIARHERSELQLQVTRLESEITAGRQIYSQYRHEATAEFRKYEGQVTRLVEALKKVVEMYKYGEIEFKGNFSERVEKGTPFYDAGQLLDELEGK